MPHPEPNPAPGSLQRVLAPRSVAVVGASKDPTKRGNQVLRTLLSSSYQGEVFAVNPGGGEILGLPVMPSIEALTGRVDLAVVCTPAASSPEVVEACGRAGVGGAVVLALGFGEMGGDGARLEADLRRAARRGGVRVIGPNTSGMLNLNVGLDLIGVPGVQPGPMALVAQSGNITLSLLQEAGSSGGPGFSVCVGVGNETEVGYHEYLEFLGRDPHTRAILVYAEGIRDGRAFLETARAVSLLKPVALLKGGRTRAGEASARSHTGSVSTSHDVFRNALRQAGVVEVERSDELLPVGRALAFQPPLPEDTGLAVLSDGGGQATLAADALSAAGTPLAALSGATTTRLRELLPPAAALGNPVDVAGACDRNPELFPELIEVLLGDGAVGGVLLVGLFGGYAVRFARELEEAEGSAAHRMVRLAADSGKALVVHSIYGEAGTPPIRTLVDGGIPVIRSLDAACRAVGALVQRGRLLARAERRGATTASVSRPRANLLLPHAAAEPHAAPDPHPAAQTHAAPHLLVAPQPLGAPRPHASPHPLAAPFREGRTTLLETEARTLLQSWGVPLVPGTFCRTPAEAAAAASRIRGPVCLKAVSSTLSHKTEAGGVILGIRGGEEAATAFRRMVRAVHRHARGQSLDPGIRGALITPFLPTPGVELLVGARRDPVFGPVLTVGAGGTTVEIQRDVALRVLPLESDEPLEMLEELRIAPLLKGYRGGAPLDLDGLDRVMRSLARCLVETPELQEIEVNPLFVYTDRVVAVDARAFLGPPPALMGSLLVPPIHAHGELP